MGESDGHGDTGAGGRENCLVLRVIEFTLGTPFMMENLGINTCKGLKFYIKDT